MSVIIPEIKHQFVALLRCRTWCDWPESSRYISQAYEEPLCFLNGDHVFLSVHLVTYAQRTRPEIKPARPLESKSGPILWRGQMDVGYWLGAHFIKAPEDTLPLGFHYEPPYEGDLDIQLHIGAVSGAPIHQLTEIASQVCTSMLAFINLALGELATPVAPLHVLALREEGAQFESSVIIAVRERRPVTSELASHAAETFAADRAGMSPLEARALAVAARRYLTSLSEADQVDKYCDLWESCEFSTMFEMAKGESGQNRTGLGVASEAERS